MENSSERLTQGHSKWSNEKSLVVSGIGDCTTPNYVEIMVNHYRDPY